MQVLVDVDIQEILSECSVGQLLSELKDRGHNVDQELIKFNMNRVMLFLKTEVCPKEILDLLDEWSRTKVTTADDLEKWLQMCGKATLKLPEGRD
jgi:hypothetical protein